MSYPQGPQYGGYPQQPPGHPQQPQQQQGYPQPGGYPPPGYPPPPKKNNGAIIALAGVAAAAVIALVLVLVLSGKDDTSTAADPGKAPNGGPPIATLPGPGKVGTGSAKPPSGGGNSASGNARALAEKAVDIIKSHSTTQIDGLACTPTAARQLKAELAKVPAGADAVVKDVKESGTTAQASIEMSLSGQTEGFTMEMKQDGGKWCVSGI